MPILDVCLRELKYALRSLVKVPGFTAITLLTIALGIGANVTTFSLANGILFRPLPYPESHEVMRIYSRFLPESGFDFQQFAVDPSEYVDFRDSNTSFEAVSAYGGTTVTITGPEGDPQRISGQAVTWNFFNVLGANPAMGRLFLPEDDVPGNDVVVILSHDFWSTRFGSDPEIVGRSLTLNGSSFEVVGVMPRDFQYRGLTSAYWVPLGLDETDLGGRQSHFLQLVGRLNDGVSVDRAQIEMEEMMAGWAIEYPDIHTGHFLFIRPAHENQVGGVRAALLALLGAVAFVFFLAVANVANLLIVREQGRQRELALIRALGASRSRIVLRHLTQSGLLAGLGGLLGLGLSVAAIRLVRASPGAPLPRLGEIGVDWTVLFFCGGLVVLATLLFGLVPMLSGAAGERLSVLREEGRSGSSRRALVARNSLVGLEVALSLVLVVGAGLMVKSFNRLLQDDVGFDAENVLTAQISLPGAGYPDVPSVLSFYRQLDERLGGLPGVVSFSRVTNLPVAATPGYLDFEIEGLAVPSDGVPTWNANFTHATPGYFESMGIDLLQGRAFQPTDRPDGGLVAVVSQSLVDRWMPDIDPVGQRIRLNGTEEWATIVGVVADIQNGGLGGVVSPQWYIPHTQIERSAFGTGGYQNLVIRSSVDPLTLVPAVRQAVGELDPELPLYGIQTLDEAVEGSTAQSRFLLMVMSAFAVLALILGGVGVYGVASYSVAQRRQEIGVRNALGASRKQVTSLVVRQSLVPVAMGLIVGVGSALMLTRWLSSLLYEVSPLDPGVFLGTAGVLALVATVASFVPAMRASKVDPVVALRVE